MKTEIEIYNKMKRKDFGESMCNETKLKVLNWVLEQLYEKRCSVIDWQEAIKNIKLIYVQFINKINMYKVVSECNKNEVWATGFYSKEKAQNRINEGYFHQYMYDADKHKKLIVVSY